MTTKRRGKRKTTAEYIDELPYPFRIKKMIANYSSKAEHQEGAFCTMYTFDDGSFISFDCDIDIFTGVF